MKIKIVDLKDNPLSHQERIEAKARHLAALNIGELWTDWLTREQKRKVLEDVILRGVETYPIERAINGDMLIWDEDYNFGSWNIYRDLLISEILARGEGAFASCIHHVPGFEKAVREILWEMVRGREVAGPNGEVY